MSNPRKEDISCMFCGDVYQNPFLTACCHTFCQGCIKRVAYNGLIVCPECDEISDAQNIEIDTKMQKIVENYCGQKVTHSSIPKALVSYQITEKCETPSKSNTESSSKTKNTGIHKNIQDLKQEIETVSKMSQSLSKNIDEITRSRNQQLLDVKKYTYNAIKQLKENQNHVESMIIKANDKVIDFLIFQQEVCYKTKMQIQNQIDFLEDQLKSHMQTVDGWSGMFDQKVEEMVKDIKLNLVKISNEKKSPVNVKQSSNWNAKSCIEVTIADDADEMDVELLQYVQDRDAIDNSEHERSRFVDKVEQELTPIYDPGALDVGAASGELITQPNTSNNSYTHSCGQNSISQSVTVQLTNSDSGTTTIKDATSSVTIHLKVPLTHSLSSIYEEGNDDDDDGDDSYDDNSFQSFSSDFSSDDESNDSSDGVGNSSDQALSPFIQEDGYTEENESSSCTGTDVNTSDNEVSPLTDHEDCQNPNTKASFTLCNGNHVLSLVRKFEEKPVFGHVTSSSGGKTDKVIQQCSSNSIQGDEGDGFVYKGKSNSAATIKREGSSKITWLKNECKNGNPSTQRLPSLIKNSCSSPHNEENFEEIPLTDSQTSNSKPFSIKFTDILKDKYQQSKCLKPDNTPFGIYLFHSHLWSACDKVICMYTLEGELLRTLTHKKMHGITSLCNTSKGIVAVDANGLHQLLPTGNYNYKIASGSYSDASYYDGLLYALDYNKYQLVTFQTNSKNKKWQNLEAITLTCSVFDPWDRLFVNKSEIFISSYMTHCVLRLDLNGKFVDQICREGSNSPGLFRCPVICGMDQSGNLLVADNETKDVQVFDAESNAWSILTLPRYTGYPRGAVVTDSGDIWISTYPPRLFKFSPLK